MSTTPSASRVAEKREEDEEAGKMAERGLPQNQRLTPPSF